MTEMHTNPDRLWSRLMDMAEVGATAAGGSNRQALSDDDKAGRDLFIGWAEGAGCSIELDPVGNLFARRAGVDPDAAPVVLGSHLDTQPTGGRFDGVYGVLGGLEVVEALNDHAVQTQAPVEVAVWTNEEGSRFAVSMMGSAVWAGVLPLEEVRAITDRSGVSVGAELDRLGWAGSAAFAKPLRAYLELHIEQGPILEASGSSIGVVTGVQGIRWFRVTIEGFPAHAGTTPMDRRRDPSRSLALALSGLHEMAAAHAPQVRLTPAMFASEPVSSNTVPAEVTFTVDLRHPDAATLESLDTELRSLVARAAETHGCGHRIEVINDCAPVVFADQCVKAVESAAQQCGYSYEQIGSGAGHDACHVALRAPTGMIFIPCQDGLSHNEAESIEPEAAGHGAEVLLHAALELAGATA
ncbi:MAG: Zn-dependent hydrolase [Acidimicrobiaceae bacterium]|nr:Zn-dependent hydrolase [Acidimicrobiaceae bacterium]MYJ41609.1 Zn-dependent hydrolase [Acidimicrobiaceae bacterium]